MGLVSKEKIVWTLGEKSSEMTENNENKFTVVVCNVKNGRLCNETWT